jgi:hypothetical protein
MANDYDRVYQWERDTGKIAIKFRQRNRVWENTPDVGDVPF